MNEQQLYKLLDSYSSEDLDDAVDSINKQIKYFYRNTLVYDQPEMGQVWIDNVNEYLLER